ncbi:MAG TPA: aminotransferase class V-fold PLP-dependent enzyme [Solirubrobacteraceae bacterium]|nr:aminotransferase class V-fold PLP-dependent enzyme [Solirubrobacteraceae bacterium]
MDHLLPRLVGQDMQVPCTDGRRRRYANLDYAASTPMMADVWEAVEAFVPYYSSVHRGTGYKSQVATDAYEDARRDVARFVGARPSDDVVFVRNTTEAINVLAAALPAGARVLSTPVEHHANMLPWRRHDVRLLPFTRSPEELLEVTEAALRSSPADLLAVTGASNVTGEVWPLAELAALAHRFGAQLLVDAAQLAPHRAIDMAATGIDYLALSGHKLYAPLGAGALVGRMPDGEPLLHGGGAIELVTVDDVIWLDAPDRFESGSPNVVGVVALAAACRRLLEVGMDTIAAHERRMARYLWDRVATVPGLELYSLWPAGSTDRIGVATFNMDGYRDPLLAAILSAEYGIGVRHGCFCAHPLMAELRGFDDDDMREFAAALRSGLKPHHPGAVRASIGIGTTAADIDRLVDALHAIERFGPRSEYAYDSEHDEFSPRALAA